MEEKQLNILFVPKWYPNELDAFDGNFIKNYAQALRQEVNISVVFVHSKENLPSLYESKLKKEKGLTEAITYFRKSNFPVLGKLINAFRYRKAQLKAYRSLAPQKFDLCHVHVLTRSSFLALRLKKKYKIPFVISEHWTGYHESIDAYNGIGKKWFTTYVAKKASGIHTVSKALQQSMERHRLLNDYTVIPNVVDVDLFQPSAKQENTCEIIYVGNLIQHHKQVLDIVKIAGELMNEGFTFHLKLYGEGKDEHLCRKLIKDNQWEKQIQVMGTACRAEIASAMAKANFLILYSETENQPCVINEAQACGLPVIVPDIPGIRERMDNRLGIVFPTSDQAAFKGALIKMIRNYTTYNKAEIRQFAVDEYSEKSIAQQFKQFYYKALKTTKAKAKNPVS